MNGNGILRILMLEDVESDAELIQHALRKHQLSCEFRREETRAGFEQAVEEFAPDLILADYNLPAYNGAHALNFARQRRPDVPVIMVTGDLGDEKAVDLIKAGARDYVLKDRLARLGPAVEQALEDARERRWRIEQEQARENSEQQFHELLDNVQLLGVILDRDGDIQYVNRHLLAVTGWSADAVLHRSWLDLFIPPEARDEMRRLLGEMLEGAAPARHHENEILTRAGQLRLIRWDNTLLRDRQGKAARIASLGADITDYRQASNQLRVSEQRFRGLIENATDIISVVDAGGIVRFVSPAVKSVGGYAPEDIVGKSFLELVHPQEHARVQEGFDLLLADPATPVVRQYRIRHADGFWLTAKTVAVNRLQTLGIEGVVVTFNDITEIEKASSEVRRSHRLLTSIIDAIPVRVFWKDRELKYLGCNRAFAEDAGFRDPQALVGKDDHDMPWQGQVEPYRADDAEVIASGQEKLLIEEAQTTPDGRQITLLTSKVPLRDDTGAVTGVIGSYMDITAHKALQSHLQLAQVLIEGSPAVLFRWRVVPGWPVDYVTENVSQWGYSAEKLLAGDPPFADLVHPDDLARAAAEVEEYAADRDCHEFSQDYRIVKPDGGVIWVDDRTTVERAEDGTAVYFQGVVTDISARKHDEQVLQRVNRALRIVSSGNAAMARAESEEALLQEICDLIVELGGFALAWVGYAEPEEPFAVRPVVSAGVPATTGYLDDLQVCWADGPLGQGPTGRCIRAGSPQVLHDVTQDEAFQPWRARALEYGIGSTIALPLADAGTTIGALNIYAQGTDAFGEDEQALLMEVAGSLAFGIRSLRARKRSLQAKEQLAKSLDSTIRALAATVEMRDPYTSGHQQRVADLAVAIGRELGLDEFRLKGLSLGASIHDIGKLRLPAEILSKPGRLSPVEFELIKGHPAAGRELLAGIEFPWPIADIVGQHHERLDGSGYPLGLQGTDILIEAQIVAVADVVEAMSSHRPYRPGLGLDVALEEIQRGRGKAFGEDVVDACIQLLRSGAFEFAEAQSR